MMEILMTVTLLVGVAAVGESVVQLYKECNRDE